MDPQEKRVMGRLNQLRIRAVPASRTVTQPGVRFEL